MKNLKIVIGILLGLAVVLGLGMYFNQQSNSGKTASKPTVKVGSKNFTESLILGEAYAQLLEANGYKVERSLNLGGTFVAHQSLQNGEIDLYPEYTGTGLLDILKKSGVAEKDERKVLNEGYSKWNLTWLNLSKANNSQGLVVSKKAADAYDLKTFSDLAEKADQLRFVAGPEFNGREDGLPGLKKAYGGFDFKSNQVIDAGLRYTSLENGEADATVAYTTDGQLTSDQFVLLEDDKHFYPTYYAAPVIRDDLLKKSPEIKKILNQFSAVLSDKVLQKLNAKVDLQGKEYQDVAKEFLKEKGLIK